RRGERLGLSTSILLSGENSKEGVPTARSAILNNYTPESILEIDEIFIDPLSQVADKGYLAEFRLLGRTIVNMDPIFFRVTPVLYMEWFGNNLVIYGEGFSDGATVALLGMSEFAIFAPTAPELACLLTGSSSLFVDGRHLQQYYVQTVRPWFGDNSDIDFN